MIINKVSYFLERACIKESHVQYCSMLPWSLDAAARPRHTLPETCYALHCAPSYVGEHVRSSESSFMSTATQECGQQVRWKERAAPRLQGRSHALQAPPAGPEHGEEAFKMREHKNSRAPHLVPQQQP